jgi:hypothetical protein
MIAAIYEAYRMHKRSAFYVVPVGGIKWKDGLSKHA